MGRRSAWLDFTKVAVSRELTRALMSEDFGVDWWVADGQLIPPVPNRLNYILWIEDLLQLSSPAGGPSTPCEISNTLGHAHGLGLVMEVGKVDYIPIQV